MDTKVLADRYIFNTYKRFPITLVKGRGCRVWDEEGREYLDFIGGIAVCALGHSSEVVSNALKSQSEILVHVSNLFYTRPQAELAELLVKHSFADKVFFCNSGAEANEAAIKLVRRYSAENYDPQRYVIIAMENSFHGRTMATLTATGQKKIQKGFDPLLNGFRHVPFNDINALKDAIDETVCAILLEPIQGEGGVICADRDYLRGVEEICKEKDILLVLDEVQVGMGRTGRLFAYEHYGIEPDVMTLAKAMANGLPIGAMLSVESVASAFGPGAHASTFGGTPLVCAVSKAVLEYILNEGVLDNCASMGKYLIEGLKEMKTKYPIIRDIRGMGLIVGVELDIKADEVVQRCMQNGILINSPKENVIRLVPPLIITQREIDQLLNTLNSIFKEYV
ncbi:MAG TPA: acetylornithine transaminase [Desulfobacteraceae bacterium]|nr:acetylornithine transaminase [Desulfobacteraceae bacterium]